MRHVLRGDVAADAENADQAAIGAANGYLEYLDQFAVTVGEGAPFLFEMTSWRSMASWSRADERSACSAGKRS